MIVITDSLSGECGVLIIRGRALKVSHGRNASEQRKTSANAQDQGTRGTGDQPLMPESAFLTSRSQRSQSILTLSSTSRTGRRSTIFFLFSLGRPLMAPSKPSSCLMAPPMGNAARP